MKYLKRFATHAEYEAYIGGSVLLPNVSICDDNPDPNHVHFNPYVPPKALKFTANGDSTLRMTIPSGVTLNLSASTDGNNWSVWNGGKINIPDGESVYIKGDNPNGICRGSSITAFSTFTMTGSIACEGNIMYLLGENVIEIPCNYCFRRLFYGCTGLTTAPELPATTLADDCYEQMFEGCTSLAAAPELPATTLADYCYEYMFSDCTNLTAAPELPATELTNDCYSGMFMGCTSLTTAPELPATELANNCYQDMFNGCTSLTMAPELPATTLVNDCYNSMFRGCTNLNSVTCLAAKISANKYSTTYWLSGVASTGTFTTPASTNWTTDASGIPSGWTRVDA